MYLYYSEVIPVLQITDPRGHHSQPSTGHFAAWILNQLSTVMVVLFGAFLIMLFSKDRLLQMMQESEVIWDATSQIYGLGNPLVKVFELGIFFYWTIPIYKLK